MALGRWEFVLINRVKRPLKRMLRRTLKRTLKGLAIGILFHGYLLRMGHCNDLTRIFHKHPAASPIISLRLRRHVYSIWAVSSNHLLLIVSASVLLSSVLKMEVISTKVNYLEKYSVIFASRGSLRCL